MVGYHEWFKHYWENNHEKKNKNHGLKLLSFYMNSYFAHGIKTTSMTFAKQLFLV